MKPKSRRSDVRGSSRAAGGAASARVPRIAGTFVAAFAALFVLLASGLSRETEVSWAIPFGLLPISFLLGLGASGLELANAQPVSRRDGLFGLAAGVATFAILRLAKLV